MKKGILKLPENRVRRNYLGGAGDGLSGKRYRIINGRIKDYKE